VTRTRSSLTNRRPTEDERKARLAFANRLRKNVGAPIAPRPTRWGKIAAGIGSAGIAVDTLFRLTHGQSFTFKSWLTLGSAVLIAIAFVGSELRKIWSEPAKPRRRN
jgi:hypothetical protein